MPKNVCLLVHVPSSNSNGTFLSVAEERARASAAPDDNVKVEDDEDGIDDSGLVFDDTSEFIRAIQYTHTAVKVEPKEEPREHPLKSATPQPQDVQMDGTEEAITELEAGEVPMKEEEDDEAILHALEGAIKSAEAAEATVKDEDEDLGVGTKAEKTYGSGMAATLNILRQQGVLAQPAADQRERERVQKSRTSG